MDDDLGISEAPPAASGAGASAGAPPLTGVRVLDLTHFHAGPRCTKLLADFGADVIKVERPAGGDPARALGPFPGDIPNLEASGTFLFLNTNKRGITLDLKTEAGRDICLALAARADIVVENFRPGVMDALGLGYPVLSALNPAVILTSISNFGQTGPYRDLPASELTLSAMGGPMNVTGYREREPLKLAGNVVQYHAGSVAAYATLLALYAVEGARAAGEPAQGEWIDVSIYETQAGFRDRRVINLTAHAYTGDTGKRGIPGSRPGAGVRPCADGFVNIHASSPSRFAEFLRLIGRADLVPIFAGVSPFTATDSDLLGEVEANYRVWLLDKTKHEAAALAQRHHLLAAPVNTVRDLVEDAGFEARGVFETVDHPATGPLRYPGRPFIMSESSRPPARRAPLLGEHTAEVLAEIGLNASGTSGSRRGLTAGADATQSKATSLPLSGVRVLDITVVWAGPHCTQLLAEWGADVIRVEPLQHIQPNTRGAEAKITREQALATRGSGSLYGAYPGYDPGSRPWNRAPSFNSHARNKRSVTLDLTYPEGRETFLRLIATADVLVENNVPETIERMGCTYPELAAVNPSLIMLRMPGYGLDGPYKNYRSFGTHMESMTGHHYLRSYPDLDPSMTGDAFTADAAGGVMGAFGVVMALRHRRLTGRGQQIELPQAENFLSYLAEPMLDFVMNGRNTTPQGNQHPSHVPHNVYPCRGDDRWIAIDVADDDEWTALGGVLGEPDWMRRPCFGERATRWRHRDELDALLVEETRRWERDDLWRALLVAGVVSGPVQDERDAFTCPQLRDRGFFESLTHPEAGTHDYPGLIFRMANTPNHLRRYPVRLGEDNDYVLHDLLDLPPEEYGRLLKNGHIGMDYPA